MQTMLSQLLSLLFPPTNFEKIVDSCVYLVPEPHKQTSSLGNTIYSCARYDDKYVRAAIKVLKKHGTAPAAKLLAQLLSDTLLEEVANKQLWNSKEILIVPVPLSQKRKRERGFNQVATVCNFLPNELQRLVSTTILKRIVHGKEQKGLQRAERLKNVQGAFQVVSLAEVNSVHVILIDDVVATGATLKEASKVLTDAGAKVTAIALARA